MGGVRRGAGLLDQGPTRPRVVRTLATMATVIRARHTTGVPGLAIAIEAVRGERCAGNARPGCWGRADANSIWHGIGTGTGYFDSECTAHVCTTRMPDAQHRLPGITIRRVGTGRCRRNSRGAEDGLRARAAVAVPPRGRVSPARRAPARPQHQGTVVRHSRHRTRSGVGQVAVAHL